MAANDHARHPRKVEETIPNTTDSPPRPVHNMSPMFPRNQSHRRLEFGSDEADRRLTPKRHEEQQLHRWMQSDIFSEPKCLINTDKSGHFAICEEALFQISAITWKLVIVGIAGPYRCGKSFLMNRLAGKSKGFFVGNTTDAATKGIWAWCQIHPEQEETVLLLLDTEGLGDIHKGDTNHDNKILTLITLLCNVLVFNMMGRFDKDSISKLSFATQISKWVKFGSDPDKREVLPIVMPELILCLRDFFLRLGDGIDSPDMYFEECLKDVEGMDEYNAPRQSLKTFFMERHCFTFPVPADEEAMYCLENADETMLKKSFVQKADQFSQHIFKCKPKKMFDSSDWSVNANIDGSIFKGLLEYHVDCTRKGIIPDIEDAFFTATRKENEKVMQDVNDEFQKKIAEIRLPVDSLDDVQDNVTKYVRMFRKRVKMDKDNKQEEQLRRDLQKMVNDMKAENSKLLQKRFADNLMKKYRSDLLETSLAYLKENGYQEYTNHLRQMKMNFENGLDQSMQSEFSLAWLMFKSKIQEDEMRVLETDKTLTQKERERKINKLKKEHDEAMKKQAETNKKQLDDEINRLSELQKEREGNYEKQLNEIREELKKFKGLGVWKRFKYLFKGSLDDDGKQ